MAKIKAPNWAKDAKPTLRGWEGKKGELLISRRHTQEQLNDFYGIKKKKRKPRVKKEKVNAPEVIQQSVLLNELSNEEKVELETELEKVLEDLTKESNELNE